MRMVCNLTLLAVMLLGCRVYAFGIDVGPVHVHGAKVKVGNKMDLKIVADSIVRDEDEKDRVRRIEAHLKNNGVDKFTIKVVWADLDDDSKAVLKKLKTDTNYKAKLEKMDDDWKLVRIRDEDD
jgi:hypothetical protein